MFGRVLSTVAAFLVITVLLLFSLEIPVMVDDRAELAHVTLGYPLHFVVQDNTRLAIGEPDSLPFPYPVDLMNPLNSSTRALLAPLLFNYLILYGTLFLLTRALRHRNFSKGGY